jgi:hypothetical protein
MKRQILIGLAGLAMVSVALARTDPNYINNGLFLCPPHTPPQIDATNFINNSAFIDNTLNSFNSTTLSLTPYATANTVNYTNTGVMGSLAGFEFDTHNSKTGQDTSAGTLYNEGGAVINCGGTNYGPYVTVTPTNGNFFLVALGFGGALCRASATNIINHGTIEMGPDSLLSLQGQNVNLSGGLLNMEGFETGDLFGFYGMFDSYWGLGQTPNYNPAADFSPFGAITPAPPGGYTVTNRYYSAMQTELAAATPYMNAITNAISITTDGTNSQIGLDISYQIVFLSTFDDTNISHNVYFPGDNIVEWVWPSTNIVTGLTQTNHLFLEDFLIVVTNVVLITNGIGPPSIGYKPTYIPTNYSLFQYGALFSGFPPATPGLPLGVIGPDTNNFSSEFTAYEALFEPTTVILSDIAGQTYTNMPGRIEVTATKQLDLTSSRISGLNYLRLTATNNFTQDRNTRILSAVADYNLGVTNATLTVSNLLAPTCPRLNGFVDAWSTAWTNFPAPVTNFTSVGTNVYYFTNSYFITVVESFLASSIPSEVQNLTLHATNVVISDVLNVLSNITIDAYHLMVVTNGPGAQTPVGQLNFPSGQLLDTASLPRLQTLTNYGVITVPNAAFFGSAAKPYWDFVNHGIVEVEGCSIWTTNFENTGLVDAHPGPINLSATSATLSNGVLNAPFNDITLSSGSLFISNQVLNAGHSLTLWATNSLNDGGTASGNVWRVAGVQGFNLPFAPPVATLLGTTITDTAPPFTSVNSQWAGRDVGPAAAGYSNNAALGRLILDGGTPGGSFVLNPPNGTNALYVDYLEFRGSMTDFDNSGNLANLHFAQEFAPGVSMKIYYAQLIINGISWAEKLNHRNGGGLNWVSSYAGAFSSTNMLYPDGTTHLLNLALVQSCDLDSNGNGIPNCLDPAPVFVGSDVALAAALTNAPQHEVVLSWNTIPNSTNYVFFKPSLSATNWQLLTNFVFGGPAAGRQRIVDPLAAGGRFYRVRVDAASP